MNTPRTLIRAAPAVERKPPVRVASVVRAMARPTAAHPVQALQQRLGSHATQGFVAQAAASMSVARSFAASPVAPEVAHSVGIAPGTAQPLAARSAGQAGSTARPTVTPAGHAEAAGQRSALAAPAQRAGTPKTTRTAPAVHAGGAQAKQAGDKEHGAKSGPNVRQAIAPAIAAVHRRASASKSHRPPEVAIGLAHDSAIRKDTERERGAAVATAHGMAAGTPRPVPKNEFRQQLQAAILAATSPVPQTEAAGKAMMKTGAKAASSVLAKDLVQQQDAAAGSMKEAAATNEAPSKQPDVRETKLQIQPAGAAPAAVSAAPVVPASLPPERLDYSDDRAPTDQAMAQNSVTPDQLKKGNDPAFGPTLEARSTAEKHEATAQAQYRQAEGKVQSDAQSKATAALAHGLGGLHAQRVAQFGKVGTKQQSAAARDLARRQELTDKIKGIKNDTKSKVDAILTEMDKEAPNIFARGLARAEQAYEAAFDEAKGGWWTSATTWGSSWDRHIARSLVTARDAYMGQVDLAIEQVSTFVDKQLNDAKACVTAGEERVNETLRGLHGSLKEFGMEATASVREDFDSMRSQIDEHRDALVNKLTDQYKASYERMSAREEELREANKSLWQRVYDATVGLIKKIIAFKDMLLGLLAKAAGLISDIISDPIGVLGNLVSAVKGGVTNFKANIGTHLQKGLMDWIFGALAGAGLQLPERFDLKGIISIVLQILGLTYANFRARAVAIVGEPVVAALEQAAEVFKVFLAEGVGGLWRFIEGKLSDLKSTLLDAIFNYIKEKVIVAGITWIIGLLNPASAFFKACKAFYDIVMFFVTRGSQIIELVNAILDSMVEIVKGNISAAALWVENALAKAIPVAIGFLASLLGLGDPSKPVKAIIEKAQSPVNKAIDWVILGAVKLVKAAGNFVKGLFGPKDKHQKNAHENDPEKGGKVLAAIAVLHQKQQAHLHSGKLSHEDATRIAAETKSEFPVLKHVRVVPGETTWNYEYSASPTAIEVGAPVAEDIADSPVKIGDTVNLLCGGDWEAATAVRYDKAVDLIFFAPISGSRRATKFGYPRISIKADYPSKQEIVFPYDAAAKGNGPYAHLPDLHDVGPRRHFTSAQKKAVIAANKAKFEGILRSDKHLNQALVPAKRKVKGVLADPDEVQIDHIYPREKGGFNSYANALVLSFTENNAKGTMIVKDLAAWLALP